MDWADWTWPPSINPVGPSENKQYKQVRARVSHLYDLISRLLLGVLKDLINIILLHHSMFSFYTHFNFSHLKPLNLFGPRAILAYYDLIIIIAINNIIKGINSNREVVIAMLSVRT